MLARETQSRTWNSVLLVYTNTENTNAMFWVDVDCLQYQFGCENFFNTVYSLMLARLSIKSQIFTECIPLVLAGIVIKI